MMHSLKNIKLCNAEQAKLVSSCWFHASLRSCCMKLSIWFRDMIKTKYVHWVLSNYNVLL